MTTGEGRGGEEEEEGLKYPTITAVPPPEEAEGREGGKNERWTQNFTIRTNVFSILSLVKRRKLVTTPPISPFPT